MDKPTLLIIDVESPKSTIITRLKNMLLDLNKGSSELHIMAFVDDLNEALFNQISRLWPGHVERIDSAQYLAMITERTRKNVSHFIAELRLRLRKVANQSAGKKWARRFDRLWWYTEISEKNSQGNPVWWSLFRMEAVKCRLEEVNYQKCLFIGGKDQMNLIKQVSSMKDVTYEAEVIERTRKLEWIKLFIHRVVLYTCQTYAIFKARRHFIHSGGLKSIQKMSRKRVLAFTVFPRVWTHRFGIWQDMYYGQTLEKLKDVKDIRPIYLLRMYDDINSHVSPKEYRSRLQMLGNSEIPEAYLIFESFGSLKETLKNYTKISDLVNHWRMKRSPDYKAAFLWGRFDLSPLFSHMMWHSIALWWPHLCTLQEMTKRAVEALKPTVTLLYTFEYIYGRALIQGIRESRTRSYIFGMQHGPITPCKLLYSGVPEELVQTKHKGPLLPQPDMYGVDGPSAKEVLVDRGIGSEAITVTGAARFDDVWHRATLSVKRLRFQNYPIKVLVAPGLHDSSFMMRFVLAALGDDPKLDLIIKPHPKISAERIQTVIDLYSQENGKKCANIKVVGHGEIYQWMEESDLFLSTYSSTGVEAIAFGMPVILLISRRIPDMSLFFGENDHVLKASTSEELRDHIHSLIAHPEERQKYVEDLKGIVYRSFYHLDSEASNRLIEVCMSECRR